MSARVRCKTCHKQFTRPTGSNRLNCEVCKPPRVLVSPAAAGAAAKPPRDAGEIETATRTELSRCKRSHTVYGAIAVRLARAMDDPALSEARLSALAAQLERTMDRATVGAEAVKDGLDARQDDLQAKIRAVS